MNQTDLNVFTQTADDLILSRDLEGLAKHLEAYTQKEYDFEKVTIEANYYYALGSCYAALYHPLESKWYAPELVETVVYYRKALAVLCKVEPTPAINQLMSMICTNLGNQLSSQGRAFCAIPYFDQAILLDNNPVAYLSKARNELFIADMIEDGGHKRCHYHTAAKLLDDVEPYLQYLHPEQLEQFQNDKNLNGFKEWFHQNFEYSDFDYFDEFEEKFGSDEEALYMYWVGGNRLFLNDLNDMSDSEIVYQDVFALSSFMSNINTLLTEAEELSYHVNFDELKNDYCYARHLMYQAFESDIDDKHYYDSSFKQIESRCGVVHSLKVNHLKSSFRTFYAIFDKIGYFIHRFFDLNDISKDDKIYIDKMFKKLNSKAFKPNDKLEDGQNFFINALFFILNDLREVKGFDLVSKWVDPEMESFSRIRNAMEHRSLVIVKKFEYELATQHNFYQEDEEKRLNQKLVELAEEISIINNSISKTREKSKQEGLAEEEVLELKQNIDELMVKRENIEKECKKLEAKKYEKEKLSTHTLHISVEEFEQRLFTLSKLVRNSIMYLSLAINLDTKIKQLNSNAIIMPRQTPLKE